MLRSKKPSFLQMTYMFSMESMSFNFTRRIVSVFSTLMVSCFVSVMVRFWMGFISLEVDMGTYLRVEEYEGFGRCELVSGGVLFVAMLLRVGKAFWLLVVVKALVGFGWD